MAKQQIKAIASFLVDGVALVADAEADFEVQSAYAERTDLQPGYYTEKDISPRIKGSVLFGRDFPLEKLLKDDNITVQLAYRNGSSVVLSKAYVAGEVVVKGEGKVELEFVGEKLQWSH